MIEERYELAIGRIREIEKESTVGSEFRDYFHEMAGFAIMIDELRTELQSGRYQALELEELKGTTGCIRIFFRIGMRPVMGIPLMP